MLTAEILDSFTGHELHGGYLTASPHLRWLASCAADGNLILRAVGALVRFLYVPSQHDRLSGQAVRDSREAMREIPDVYPVFHGS